MFQTLSETPIYEYTDSNNGSDPLWGMGSSCLVQIGERLFASGTETIAGAPPQNNCRWLLYECVAGKWVQRITDRTHRRLLGAPLNEGMTREPSPIVGLSDGTLWMSTNPTIEPGSVTGRSLPQLLQWNADNVQSMVRPTVHLPRWPEAARFCEHSYRSFVCDAANCELFLMHLVEYQSGYWSFRDRKGNWSACGKLEMPFEPAYPPGHQWMRVAYPTIQLKNREVHLCGMVSMPEPNSEWQKYKESLPGEQWADHFRRLFYTRSRDIRTGRFEPWVEITSRDSTCGRTTPCDLHVDDRGRVHILWIEVAIDKRLRAKFFPEARQSFQLNYVVLDDGVEILRKTLVQYDEIDGQDQQSEIRYAKFHVGVGGRLFVYYDDSVYVPGCRMPFNHVFEIYDGSARSPAYTLPLTSPLMNFYTTTPRAGSPPSNVLHLMGEPRENFHAIKHVAVKLMT